MKVYYDFYIFPKLMKLPQRIMLKLSWEALKWKGSYGFDIEFVDQLAKKIVVLSQKGFEIAVVLWGGNIFRGVTGSEKGMDRATGDYIGMLATVMNGIALGEALVRNGQDARVLSSLDMPKVAESFVTKKALHYISQKKVVICVAGTGNPFFTTDTGAVQKSLELGCQMMIKWTKVDGVYDKDPMKYTDAKRFETLSMKKALEIWVNVMDHAAIAMAMDNNLPLYVCRIDSIDQLGNDDHLWTLVTIS